MRSREGVIIPILDVWLISYPAEVCTTAKGITMAQARQGHPRSKCASGCRGWPLGTDRQGDRLSDCTGRAHLVQVFGDDLVAVVRLLIHYTTLHSTHALRRLIACDHGAPLNCSPIVMKLRLPHLTLYKEEMGKENQGTSGESRRLRRSRVRSNWLQRQDSNLRPSG